MKFIPIDPREIPAVREGVRGRIAMPIVKSFLETVLTGGKPLVLAKLDKSEIPHDRPEKMASALATYLRSHELPVKSFMRRGEIYLLRLDFDDKGNPIPNWKEKLRAERSEAKSMSDGYQNEDEARRALQENPELATSLTRE